MTVSLLEFESQQPTAVRYFTQALSSGHFVNAYILAGPDLATSYKLALRLAQIINCANPPDAVSACGQCQSCRWIADNAHPGLMTLTNLTYLLTVDPETGAVKTRSGKPPVSILVDQLTALLNELSMHAGGFRRVVVLAGAEETGEAETARQITAPRDWVAQEAGHGLSLKPLDQTIFKPLMANKFLKTLEEPPRDVVFFLLTDTTDKLLDTIVSRCQPIPMRTPAGFHEMPLPLDLQDGFARLLGERDYLAAHTNFAGLVEATETPAPQMLSLFTAFVGEQLRLPPHTQARARRFADMMTAIEHSRRMLDAHVREEAALEDLFLRLTGVLPLSS